MILPERAFPERIAALVPSEGISGFGRQVTALARALQGAGVDCLVVALHRRGRAPPTFLPHPPQARGEHCGLAGRGPPDRRVGLWGETGVRPRPPCTLAD